MPRLRSDIVEVYVIRRPGSFLQMRRREPPLRGTWQPVIGHLEGAEDAPTGARRELEEETGLRRAPMWALEQVHPYYLPESDEIICAPRFCVEAPAEWEPVLNEEHDDWRWIDVARARDALHWPSQWHAMDEIRDVILSGHAAANALRLD
ncbi:MAG: NUDIX domain-containing protein [Phycisphaerales bacterium]|nr:NUDIX domain-containing protein [Phycisphaerales bacterium]